MKHKTKYRAMDIKEFELPMEGTVMPQSINISSTPTKRKKSSTPKPQSVSKQKAKDINKKK
ncbi:MAG: hypothetical protein U0T31_04410 [Chitinophagales bacterium]